MQDLLTYLKDHVVLMDGAMGTYIYEKGIFIDKCYDEVNLTRPDLIQTIHKEYLDAGSKIIETNTFGANRISLKKHYLADKIESINIEGARLAKEAAGDDAWIAGSMGPLGVEIEPYGDLSEKEVAKIYAEQAGYLYKGNVDLFILETFRNVDEILAAIKGVKSASNLPVLAMMTINSEGTTSYGLSVREVIQKLNDAPVEMIGINCTTGPKSMLDFLESVNSYTEKPFAIVPNAGLPQMIDGRSFYMSTPDYFSVYTKRFIEAGARLIGGCCGTTPDHIQKMSESLAQKQTRIQSTIQIQSPESQTTVEPVPAPEKSRLAKRLHEGHFVTLVEMVSPRGVDTSKQKAGAALLKKNGIDVINIPDGPRASSRMNGLALSLHLQNDVGIEAMLHYTCRDRNILGMQSDLLGAASLGIHNILAITGDPPMMGDYPNATAVFDVDAIGLSHLIQQLNHGQDMGGKAIGEPTSYFYGVGVDPNSVNPEHEINRYNQKLQAGAEFVITQPVFDLDAFNSFMNQIDTSNIFLIAGVWPLVSLRNAEFMRNEVPGVTVPDSIMEKMAQFEQKEDQLKVGIEFAVQMVESLKNHIQGIQASAPFGRYQLTLDVLSPVLKTLDKSA